ncbi:MAG: hypothetical protein MK111_26320 [Crocosphaera sp.]|uniref:hypothetical protein n=1 Tax=Crocosphaera sp. TaxID=2729996 RepID=UPI00258A0D0D|nr:hypothetical protein [Crocosphaera sp.]MCH2248096.1 hypothetical protein [Crocosphaera sp.]
MPKRVPLSERKSSTPKGVDAVIQPTDNETVDKNEKTVEKVTLYIRPEQVIALEQIQLQTRKRTGKKPKKSELVQEALDLLIEKYS